MTNMLTKPRYELRQNARGWWAPWDSFPQAFCEFEKEYHNHATGLHRVAAMNAAYERGLAA